MSIAHPPLTNTIAVEEFLTSAEQEMRRLVDAVLAKTDCAADGWTWREWADWTSARPGGSHLVLTVEDGNALFECVDELNTALEGTIFFFDYQRYAVAVFQVDSWKYPDLHAYVAERTMLRWLRSLVAPDLAAVYYDVFDWFSARGASLTELHWREAEELIAASFAAQGMSVELGPGRADGGIDLHLVEHDVFGDVLTAVQIKSGKRSVRLHYVQALAAASMADGNRRSLFVSASRYEPAAERWAGRWEEATGHQLELAGHADVELWCAAARDRTWYPDRTLRDPEPRGSGSLVGRVMVATTGYGITTHRFGLVVRQTKRAVLLRSLTRSIVEGDIQQGVETPVLDAPPPEPPIYIAARNLDGDGRHFFDPAGDMFAVWNGQPMWFTTMD
jgi:Restriction endonuclease